MRKTSHDRPGAALCRRGFMRQLGAVGLGLAAVRVALASSAERRSLSFVHTHTGEQLTTEYYAGGDYRADELQRVNVLLRDFRNDQVFPIDPKVLDRLFFLQSVSGGSEPFQIISGYRSAATNAALRAKSTGVAEHSLHMEGRAIDVRLPGVATAALARLARQQACGGVGLYRISDFVHVDTGRVRSWGDPIDV